MDYDMLFCICVACQVVSIIVVSQISMNHSVTIKILVECSLNSFKVLLEVFWGY